MGRSFTCIHALWLLVGALVIVGLAFNRYSCARNNRAVDENVPIATYERPIRCPANIPCAYPEVVDFRIIVITYNRKDSTLKCLNALNNIILDGATASLEIWIDQSKQNTVHFETLRMAQNFNWEKGPKRTHIQEQHVGIYGQWIDTWKPNGTELALILEDDISVSPYVWRWIKAAHKKFGSRSDILGYSLQSEGVNFAVGGGGLEADENIPVFLNRVVGSWGFIPHPKVWGNFQNWFHKVIKDKSFKPYVGGGVVFDTWYKSFEKKGSQDSMWTIWFIKYTNDRNMYCVYSNIAQFSKSKDHKIAVHRAEPGLHFHGHGKNNEHELLSEWKEAYIDFPSKVPRYEFNGTMTMVDI